MPGFTATVAASRTEVARYWTQRKLLSQEGE
jgi:hypothetical protein